MISCIYRGQVEHRRMTPIEHRFRYPISWLYVDLDELPKVMRTCRLLSDRRYAPMAFLRSDHHGPPAQPLPASIRDLVEQKTGQRPDGPIRLLTQIRQFGLYFSPLNLYYCFDSDSLSAVVAEVSNTPWNERYHYVLLPQRRSEESIYRDHHPKSFHVSPFMDMESDYLWALGLPDDEFRVSMQCHRAGSDVLRINMLLQRRELNDTQLAKMAVRYPVAALQTLSAIYFQALRLWMKKCPFYQHPKKQSSPTGQVA